MNPPSKPASDRNKPKRPILRWILVLARCPGARDAWAGAAGSTSRSSATPGRIRPHPPTPSPSSARQNTTGHPSPVFRARLDHAESLYSRGIAPLIITLGGDGGDQYSEGAVGQQYLKAPVFPSPTSSPKPKARSTDESVRRLAVIARANSLHRIVVVSDATHLFRIHQICAADGLDVLTSPRPRVPIEGNTGETERIEHEILSYTLWRLHLD